MKRRATISAVLVALALSACGGEKPESNDHADAERNPVRDDAGHERAPPEFLDCIADQGYELSPTDDIHAAPPEILQTCFESLHQGG
jgi:hypothetical protein